MSQDMEREAFEAWASKNFYAGLADVADTWDAERKTYTDFAHHMAWCAYRAALAIQPPAVQGEPRKFAGWLVSNSEGDDEFVNNPTALAGRHYKGRSPLLLEIHETTSGIHSRGEGES